VPGIQSVMYKRQKRVARREGYALRANVRGTVVAALVVRPSCLVSVSGKCDERRTQYNGTRRTPPRKQQWQSAAAP